nr:N-acylneuraminate cytidylyltransferase-like [Nothobranchius furzeri]
MLEFIFQALKGSVQTSCDDKSWKCLTGLVLILLGILLFSHRYGYFGRGVSLMFCKVSGCLTDGRIFLTASGEDMVSIHTKDTTGIRKLQKDDVEVLLLTSSEDPVAQLLADKLKKLTGCEVMQVGEDPLSDVLPVVKERNLDWKDVAYMGKAAVPYLCTCGGFSIIDLNIQLCHSSDQPGTRQLLKSVS